MKRFYVVKRNTKQTSKFAKNDIQKLCETLRHEIFEKQLRKSTQFNRDLMFFEIETLFQNEKTKFNKRQCDNNYIITNNDVQKNNDVLNYISKNKNDKKNVDIRNIVIVDLKTSNLSKIYDCNENDENDNHMINNMY